MTMLSISKLNSANTDYYLKGGDDPTTKARDYYAGHTKGYWLGADTSALGVEVTDEQFRWLLEGKDVSSGEERAVLKVQGLDLTFSAPKSVSLLWAFGTETQKSIIVAAHREAIAKALMFAEREITYVRRGAGGKTSLGTKGLQAAVFEHSISRELDMQLHSHLVLNILAEGLDGAVTAVHSTPFFRNSKLLGSIYQAQLRNLLSAQLGVGWGPVKNGAGDIAGFDRELLKRFSKRSQQIEGRLKGSRENATGRERERAALATRRAKVHLSEQAIRENWISDLSDFGLTSLDVQSLASQSRATQPALSVNAINALLESAEGITRDSAHFDRRAAILQWLEFSPADQSPAETIRLCDEWLARAVTLKAPRNVPYGWAKARYSTVDMLLVEQEALSILKALEAKSSQLVCSPAAVSQASIDFTLNAEQERVVASICLGGSSQNILIGVAGAGKTHTVAAATSVLQQSGARVIGTAVAANAAVQLGSEAGLDHYSSVAKLLHDLDRGFTIKIDRSETSTKEAFALNSNDIVVLDEASTIGSRTMLQLLRYVQDANASLLAVGDPYQLGSVESGGLLSQLTQEANFLELRDTVRASELWERTAQLAYRSGNDRESFDAYQDHNRLSVIADREVAYEDVLASWWRQKDRYEDVLIFAHRRSDVRRLNLEMQQRLRDDGKVSGEWQCRCPLEIECDHYQFGRNDRVIIKKNDARLDLRNGQRATVSRIHRDGSLSIVLDDGQQTRRLGREQIEDGAFVLGHALTVFASQGQTSDSSIFLADSLMQATMCYSAITRGRQENSVIYVADPESDVTPEDQLFRSWSNHNKEKTATLVLHEATAAKANNPLSTGTQDNGLSFEEELTRRNYLRILSAEQTKALDAEKFLARDELEIEL